MRLLFFDCFSGASGDMILGALLDAGAPETEVRSALETLGLGGWELRVSMEERGGLRARRAKVITEDNHTSRPYGEIRSLLEAAPLREAVRDRALKAFRLLATAEGRVHGVDPDDVQLHEVGSLDAIVDVVAGAAALEHFTPARVVTSPVVVGSGVVESHHGRLPVPAPAVLEILSGAGGIVTGGGSGELITPTGAALLAAFSDGFGQLPPMRIEAAGYGAGERDNDLPNVVRVLVGTESDHAPRSALMIETNVDDMNPELLPHVIERLLDAGAQDAWITPIIMKKGRPALTLGALIDPRDRDAAAEIIFRETSTLGVRVSVVDKYMLERDSITTEVAGKVVRVKVGRRGKDIVTLAPEFEDALSVARATGMPLRRVYELAVEAARNKMPPV